MVYLRIKSLHIFPDCAIIMMNHWVFDTDFLFPMHNIPGGTSS